ncbi:enoyl-(Acyl carrier protein) reductase [Hirsutella rhossiliensis]
MRSYSGCLTCRQRKLKCDESKPLCDNCRRSSRECVFLDRSIFRGFESQPSSGCKGLFADSQVWLEVPPRQHQPGTTSIPMPVGEDGSASTGSSPECQARENIMVLRLLSHFKHGPGQWMDVFDTGAYFSHKAPVLATTRPLLKSAICALAAKHLRHIQRCRGSCHGRPSPACRVLYDSSQSDDKVDWQYQSAKHYHKAISQLKTAVHLGHFDTDSISREELFAAIAILCTCELMDAPGTAWRAHLSALPLFSQVHEPGSSPCSPVVIPRAAISGPIFWSPARQGLLCAFISETQTRLYLDDVRLWQNAGLVTDENGSPVSFNPASVGGVRTTADVEEDTRGNEIHWLLGKIANYITSGDAVHPDEYVLSREQRPLIGVTQELLLGRWTLLTQELQKWRHSLPESFLPAARTSMADHSPDAGCLARFEQIWYQVPVCAATMQSYHMACILLLVNEPQEAIAIRSTVSARLQSYRRGEREALRHARELCGISLAKSSDANRVHSVQPLFVAGQVFEDSQDVKVVLDLLEEIERDLGWATSHYLYTGELTFWSTTQAFQSRQAMNHSELMRRPRIDIKARQVVFWGPWMDYQHVVHLCLIGGYHNVAYATSKGAVSDLMRQVALDYAQDGIHCNAICPGFIDTAIFVNLLKTRNAEGIRALHPLHGIGTPENIVGAAIFLASHEAAWITGACCQQMEVSRPSDDLFELKVADTNP